MSTATPTPADLELAQPAIDAYNAGLIDRRGYWHAVEQELRAARPSYSARDVTRVARIMAPFWLRDRYADH